MTRRILLADADAFYVSVARLVDPEGADMAGLGDSTAHLRLALRNPLDDGKADLRRVTVPAVLQGPALTPRGTKKR